MYVGRPISGSILIVDNERELSERLEVFLRKRGYRVASSANASEALASITQESFDLILVAAVAPGSPGLQFLDQTRSCRGETAVVVMSAYATVEQGVEAMRRGVADYITKPFQLYEVAKVIERVMERRREDPAHRTLPARKNNNGRNPREATNLQRKLDSQIEHSSSELPGNARAALIGSSEAMKQLFAIIDRIAPMDSSVLITGATGTGKELVAHAIHERSRRAKAPFVDINCSAIPDTLVEAELFGHQRGTFTGANETRRGLFEEASGGTILLDEVDALDLSAQAKLLRVLQERTLRRVGGRENISIDVRIISATNSDLMAAVAKGRFRADLLFRLRVVPLQIPTLHERGNDIKLLIDHFLRRHTERSGTEHRSFSADALKVLLEYRWPGNVRELENAVEYALAIGTTEELGIDDLPPNVLKNSEIHTDALRAYSSGNLRLAEVERRYIIATLERFGGHQIKTAEALGIDRRTLYVAAHLRV
jgi:DNA-binding NtrC family response regulator